MTGAVFGLGKFRMPQSVPGSKCYPCFKIRFPKYLSWVWGTSVFPWRLYVPLRPKVLTGGWWLPVKTSEESREADFLCNWPLKDGVWSTHPLCSWKSGCKRPRFDPWVRKFPWRRKRQPAPVFWPGEFCGLYSPWGPKESDMAERLSLSLALYMADLPLLYNLVCSYLMVVSFAFLWWLMILRFCQIFAFCTNLMSSFKHEWQ